MVPANQAPFVSGEAAGSKVVVAQRRAEFLRGLDARLHRQQHARGKNRVQERARVPGEDVSIAGVTTVEIRVVGVEAGGAHRRRLPDEQGSGRRLVQEVVEGGLRRGPRVRVVDLLRHDGADADDRVADGDEPEPPAVRSGHHADVAGAPPLAARNANVLAVDGNVPEQRILAPFTEALGKKSDTSRSVDDGSGANRRLEAVRACVSQRDSVWRRMTACFARCPCSTCAPHRAAWSSSTWSNRARGT